MATMLATFESDVEEVESELPVTFTFDGTDYTGQKSENIESQAMLDAGFKSEIEFNLEARASIFTVEPEVRDEITIATVEYRIATKTPSQDGIMLTLALTKNT